MHVTKTEEHITKSGLENSSAKMLAPGTILYSIFASIGATAMLDISAATNQAIAGIKLKSNAINNKFLYYWLKSQESVSKHSGRGVAQNNINLTILRNMIVPVYSAPVQESIVGYFEHVESEINQVNLAITKLDILVKSRFVDMFGDQKTNNLGLPTSKLGNVAFVGSSKRVFKDELKDSGVPFFRGTEVGALAFSERIKPELFITREHYDELVAHTGKPEVGDLLMPSICPGGQIWLVDTTKPFYFKDGRVLWVRPDHEILDSTFLQYALRNRFVSDFDSFASGTTFAELKIFVLKDLDVTLPSLSLQREFADFASRVDKLRVVAEEQKKKLQTLYDSLAQEYFAI